MPRYPAVARAWTRGRWRAGLLIVALAAVFGAMVLASYPLWATGLLEATFSRKVQDRFGLRASLLDVDLGYGRVDVGALRLVGDGVSIELRDVGVTFDREYPWSTSVEVHDVSVASGSAAAEFDALRNLIARTEGKVSPGSGRSSSRGSSILPETLGVESLEFDLGVALGGEDAAQRVTGVATLLAAPRKRRGELTLARLRLGSNSHALARADRLHLVVESDEMGGLQFPIRVEVAGGASSLTPQIELAGSSGTIEITDADVSSLRIDLGGTFADAASAGSVGGTRLWSLSGWARRDLTAGELTLDMEAFELGKIPQVLARLPVVASERATVRGRLEMAFAEGKGNLEGTVALAGVNVSHPLLASEVVRGVGFELDFSVQVDPANHTALIRHASITRGGVSLELEGEVVHPPKLEQRRYRLRARTPKVACQAVLDAIPDELVPSLIGFKLGGRFDMDVTVDVDYANLEAVSMKGSVGLWGCRVRRAPARVAADRLSGGFSHRVTMRDGSQRLVRLYGASPSFTPFDRISPNMVAAVLTTEDGGFWKHRGFLPSQFEGALRRNLQLGRIHVGASTITMQTVKNVMLSHERTMSRKLQELFLTWYIERSLSKQRIMEIYLNVIEFGPGIYGVTHAARHYFGKAPHELSSLESAYLSLMLPSPVRRHMHYCRDKLTKKFDVKLRRIHKLMYTRDRIDELDYVLWQDAEIRFSGADRGDERSCLNEIKRLLEATHGQRAVSGLLGGTEIPDDDLEGWILEGAGDATTGEDPAASNAPGRPAMDPLE